MEHLNLLPIINFCVLIKMQNYSSKRQKVEKKKTALLYQDLVYIRSIDRAPQSNSPTDFTVVFKNATIHDVKSARLVNATIPSTVYNIVTGVNDTISFIAPTGAGLPKLGVIPPGFYDQTSFPTAVALAMNTADPGHPTYSVTFNTINNKLVFTNSAYTFTIYTNNIYAAPYEPLLNLQAGFALLDSTIGTTGYTSSSVSGTQTINPPNIMNLNTPLHFLLLIQEIGARTLTTNPADQASFIIPNNVNSGDTIDYFPEITWDQTFELPHVLNTNKLTVQLLLPGGLGVANLNGANWTFILQLE